jgi:hypothetical protein
MSRSVRLYTTAQVDEMRALIESVSTRPELPRHERERLSAFEADLRQTAREDRRRAAGTARLAASAAGGPSD